MGVEGGQEGGGEEGVPGRERRDPREPELRHEPILEGVPQALNPPLRLGALGHEMGNRQRGERVADLRRVLMALEFLSERPVRIVAHKDTVAVRVHRRREPHRLTEGAEEGEVAGRVLLDPKRAARTAPVASSMAPRRLQAGWVGPNHAKGLPSSWHSSPAWARRGRRLRCSGGRRRRGDPTPAARKIGGPSRG